MENSISITWLAVLVSLAIVAVGAIRRTVRNRIKRQEYPPPPGPASLPLLGSIFSINTKNPWLTYTSWREKYGDIIYFRILCTDVVVLNSTTVAINLLEKRSRLYSDRPFISTMVPYGHDCNFTFWPYGKRWILSRRIFQQTFRANAALKFRPMQLRSARQLISNIIQNPNEYPSHFSTFSTSMGMSVVYGYEPSSRNDPVVSVVDNYLKAAFSGLAPSKIALFKFKGQVLHIPEWLPGSWINHETKVASAWMDKMVEMPYELVQKRMESGEDMNVSMVSDHITRMKNISGAHRSEYEIALKHAAVSAIIGSSETTSSALMTFTLAMVENPHVWKRAQTIIDSVVGSARLPNFNDRPNLPYIDAIMRENFRWRPVIPLIGHASIQSDIYEGYHIPKGTNIFTNVWGLSRDESRYPDAERFNPERFLDEKGMLTDDDPSEFIFGIGRRRCPGRYAADASLWSVIATMLATLDFNLAQDADGKDITFEPTFTSGATDHPNPFPCGLTPRPHISEELLERALDH